METDKEAIYKFVTNCVQDNSLEVLQVKINQLKSIIDYKDAPELLDECYKKEKKVKRKLRRKKIVKIIINVLDYLMLALAIILCVLVLTRRRLW